MRRLLFLIVPFVLLAATVAPAGAQTRAACGYNVPEGYNLIQSNARIIRGTTGPDFICAGNGSNIIRGKGGADAIFGQGGNDVIFGGFGHDFILGGDGIDRITAGGGRDYVDAGPGNDTVFGGQGWDELFGGGGNDTMTGGSGNDLLNGGDGADRLTANQGADTLVGDAGNDVLRGGVGNDILRGDDGNDRLMGGDQDDELDGSNGNDVILGMAGNDVLTTGHGDDLLDGGPGNDQITTLFSGDKQIVGGAGVDKCGVSDGPGGTENGCEPWFDNWFDNGSSGFAPTSWLTVEHHVAGGPVASGFVHVGVDNWNDRNLNLDDDSTVALSVHRFASGPVVRSFTEDLVPVYNDYNTIIGQDFRKRMSAATVRQGREVKVVGSTSKWAAQLEVHLTGAVFDSASNSLAISGTPGKEVTVVARGSGGEVLGLVHLPIADNGILEVSLQALPSEWTEIDVMRFNGYGHFEQFDGVVRNAALTHEVGSSVVGLTERPLSGSVEITLHDQAGSQVDSAVATKASGWKVDFGTALVNGQEIRAQLNGPSGAKSLVVSELSVTGTEEDFDIFNVIVSGNGPVGSSIEGVLYEAFQAEIDDGLPVEKATFDDVPVAGDGTWSVDIDQSFVFLGGAPAGEIRAVDPDGDRLVLLYGPQLSPPR